MLQVSELPGMRHICCFVLDRYSTVSLHRKDVEVRIKSFH